MRDSIRFSDDELEMVANFDADNKAIAEHCIFTLLDGDNEIDINLQDLAMTVGYNMNFECVNYNKNKGGDESAEQFIERIKQLHEDRIGGVVLQFVGNISLADAGIIAAKFENSLKGVDIIMAYCGDARFADGVGIIGVYL